MGPQDSGDNDEARRVSAIFGVLTFVPMLLMGAMVDMVLTVTTGQDGRALAFGLIPATLLALVCGTMVARHTRSSLQEHQSA